MSEIKNLWPEEIADENSIILPSTILIEQAKYFNEYTKNVLSANVITKKITIGGSIFEDSRPGISHTLSVNAPSLGSFSFDLVRIIQENILPYPVTVLSLLSEEKFKADGSNEVENALEIIFRNKSVIQSIQSIIQQSKGIIDEI